MNRSLPPTISVYGSEDNLERNSFLMFGYCNINKVFDESKKALSVLTHSFEVEFLSL